MRAGHLFVCDAELAWQAPTASIPQATHLQQKSLMALSMSLSYKLLGMRENDTASLMRPLNNVVKIKCEPTNLGLGQQALLQAYHSDSNVHPTNEPRLSSGNKGSRKLQSSFYCKAGASSPHMTINACFPSGPTGWTVRHFHRDLLAGCKALAFFTQCPLDDALATLPARSICPKVVSPLAGSKS